MRVAGNASNLYFAGIFKVYFTNNAPTHQQTAKQKSKVFVLQKKDIRAINNLSYNEHPNAYFKCNKILKLLISKSFKFRTIFSIITLQY